MKRVVVCCALLLASLGAALGGVARTAPAERRAEVFERRFIGNPDAVRAGEKLFRRHCAECHGEDGRGNGKAKNLRAASVQAKTAAELEDFLRNGNLRKGMPSWSGLPAERRWQIVAYLKTLPTAKDVGDGAAN